jgi:hypothetical protein
MIATSRDVPKAKGGFCVDPRAEANSEAILSAECCCPCLTWSHVAGRTVVVVVSFVVVVAIERIHRDE